MIFPRVNFCTFADDRILHSKGKGEAAHGGLAYWLDCEDYIAIDGVDAAERAATLLLRS